MDWWKKHIQLMYFRSWDNEIKNIAQGEHIPFPEDFSEKMNRLYKNLPEGVSLYHNVRLARNHLADKRHRRRIHIPYVRYGAVLAGIACLFFVVTPVSANLQGYWRRMINMTEKEKKEQLLKLEESTANGDSFSRALTKSESRRIEALTLSYEEAGNFPAEKITYIDNETEVQQNRVCFLSENSTFYLPKNELTNEQILQIIDFNHKREYSLYDSHSLYDSQTAHSGIYDEKSDGAETKKPTRDEELFRRDAAALGEKWLRTVYGKNVSNWETSIQKKDGPKHGYDIYAISYRNQTAPAKYSVTIHAETGELLEIHCPYNGKRKNMSKGLSVRNNRAIRKKYEEVKKRLRKAGYTKDIVSCYCEYMLDEKTNMLSYGIVNFIIQYSDGTGLEIHYSYNSKDYYLISFIEDMTTKAKQETISHAKYSAKIFVRTRLE